MSDSLTRLRLASVSSWVAELRASGMPETEVQVEVSRYFKRRELFFNGAQAIDAAEANRKAEEAAYDAECRVDEDWDWDEEEDQLYSGEEESEDWLRDPRPGRCPDCYMLYNKSVFGGCPNCENPA